MQAKLPQHVNYRTDPPPSDCFDLTGRHDGRFTQSFARSDLQDRAHALVVRNFVVRCTK